MGSNGLKGSGKGWWTTLMGTFPRHGLSWVHLPLQSYIFAAHGHILSTWLVGTCTWPFLAMSHPRAFIVRVWPTMYAPPQSTTHPEFQELDLPLEKVGSLPTLWNIAEPTNEDIQ